MKKLQNFYQGEIIEVSFKKARQGIISSINFWSYHRLSKKIFRWNLLLLFF